MTRCVAFGAFLDKLQPGVLFFLHSAARGTFFPTNTALERI
jgi:hypothetical protein